MASTTKVRTISAVDETAIKMTNSKWARRVDLPAGWLKVRFGIRFHMTNSGANLTSTPTLTMGFCSGTSAVPGDATPAHFAGFRTVFTPWVYSGGSGVAGDYQLSSMPINFATNILGTWANTSGGNINWYPNAGAASSAADRGMLFVDMTRVDTTGASATYTFNLFYMNNPTVGNTSETTFLNTMALSTPSASGHTYSSGINMTIDQANNGTFNAVCMYWDRSDADFEVCDISIARLA